MNLFHLVGPSPFWVHVMITKYSTSFIRSPIIETAIPTTMANHTIISTYWYKTCWLSSHTNLYLLITPVFMSLADSWTSHNPNVGNNAFPGLGEWRTPARKYECCTEKYSQWIEWIWDPLNATTFLAWKYR